MGKINFKTYSQLAIDIRKSIHKIPSDIDLIVGIPRSGMIPAYIIGSFLNLPVSSLDEYLEGVIPSNGERPIINRNNKIKKILIVDDSIDSGNSIAKVKKNIKDKNIKDIILYFAVYSTNTGRKIIDIYSSVCEQPRIFQWNYMNHSILEKACFDMDGILCVDPTEEQNDDGKKYINFILNAKPLYIPKYKIKAIITSRLEKYRSQTERWLKENNVIYDSLYMLNLPSKEERIKQNIHAKFKAEIYKKLDDCILFIESERNQAIEISKMTDKAVICLPTDEFFLSSFDLNFFNNKIKAKNNGIKIVFLSHTSGLGGAEKSMLELIDGLYKKGVSCRVLVPSIGLLTDELTKKNIEFDVVFLPWCANGDGKYSDDKVEEISKSILDIIPHINKDIPDIIYSNSSVIFQGGIISKIFGIKHIWHIREFGESDYGIDFYLPIKDRAQFIFENSDKIIFISKSLMDYYHNYIPNSKSELVYNNVKIEPNFIINNNQHNDNLLLLMIGNIHQAKGQIDALKALKILKDKGIKDITLDIVGNKNVKYYKELLEFIKINELDSQVNFFDYTKNPSQFYQKSDVLLMCSREEAFGRVTVEAMLFNKPVIGSNSGGTPEIIEEGVNGFLYRKEDYFDLSEKIMFFYKNRSKIIEFGQKGKIFCEKKFSDKNYVDTIFNIILNIKDSINLKIKDLFSNFIREDVNLKDQLISKLELNKFEIINLEKKYKEELILKDKELSNIYSSRGWRLVSLFRKYLYKIFPNDKLRKKFITIVFSSLKKIAKFFRKVFGKTIGLFLIIKNYLLRFKPKKKRNINYNSKKILFIGHSFHLKTKSSDFMIKYLKQFFEVEVIFDNSWEDGEQTDFSFIDNNYLGVIFWQLLPDCKVLKNIKNDNIIFFPMYDGVRLDYQFWSGLRNLKIINFSKTLHNKLRKWGFESMYIQYFPEPKDFIPGDKNKIFFWQRLTHININTITKLFKNKKVGIHIHKAVDPWQQFIEPTKKQEKDFNITYSDWFPNKEDMSNLIKEKGIYVAPREYEGIGMSFLEAMAMGKAVVAIDNPTMNEYIKDGVNGYLFNLRHPKVIDLSNIEQVQKNAYKYMQDGYKKLEEGKIKIIKFIRNE